MILISALKTRDFWVEYISLFVSITIVTLIVQMGILHMEIGIIVFSLIKSLLLTVPNIICIMYGRRITIVTNHWFLETIIYVIFSVPYMEISLIYLYKKDILLSIDMIKWYAIIYFAMGLFIKWYVNLSKRLINKIFDGDFF